MRDMNARLAADYRRAAQLMLESLRETYPELDPDSLSILCYFGAMELQRTEGNAALSSADEFADTVCEQVVTLSEQFQAVGPRAVPVLARMPELPC